LKGTRKATFAAGTKTEDGVANSDMMDPVAVAEREALLMRASIYEVATNIDDDFEVASSRSSSSSKFTETYLNDMSAKDFHSDDSTSIHGGLHESDDDRGIELQVKAQQVSMWLSTDDFQASYDQILQMGETANANDSDSSSSDEYNVYRNEALDELEKEAEHRKSLTDTKSQKTTVSTEASELTDEAMHPSVEKQIKSLWYSADYLSDDPSYSESTSSSTHHASGNGNSTNFGDFPELLSAESENEKDSSVYEATSDTSESGHEVASQTSHEETPDQNAGSMHIKISNQHSDRSVDFDVPISSDLTVFESIYDDEKTLSAGVRKWKKSIARLVKGGSHEVSCRIFESNGIQSLSVEEMKKTSTQDLASLLPKPIETVTLALQCKEKKMAQRSSLKKELHVRVTNELSGVYRDLRLSASTDLNVFETVYQNDVVLSGNVRLWPQDTAAMVMSGTHEIQCLLDHENHSRVFSISELKTISTADLANIATEIEDPLRLVLRCREVAT